MKNFFSRLKQEILGVIPTAVFFFIAFQLLALTRALTLRQYDIEISTFVAATVGALIVAKVVMVVDLLPFINRFPDKPLVYNIAWKATIYFVAALFVRYVENLFPFVWEFGDIATANRHLFDEVPWARFWIIQIWLFVLLLIYSVMTELVRVFGRKQVRAVFLGPANPGAN
ncbi:MAG: hypothetical protein ACR2QZ_11830 [Woeseiaceae bacterium]